MAPLGRIHHPIAPYFRPPCRSSPAETSPIILPQTPLLASDKKGEGVGIPLSVALVLTALAIGLNLRLVKRTTGDNSFQEQMSLSAMASDPITLTIFLSMAFRIQRGFHQKVRLGTVQGAGG